MLNRCDGIKKACGNYTDLVAATEEGSYENVRVKHFVIDEGNPQIISLSFEKGGQPVTRFMAAGRLLKAIEYFNETFVLDVKELAGNNP